MMTPSEVGSTVKMPRMYSLRNKLTLISLATTGAALLAISLVLVALEALSFRHSLIDSLTVQADMIGSNMTVALSFGNVKDADEVLGAMSASTNIVQAVVYARNDDVFAVYRKDMSVPPAHPLFGHQFGINHLALVRPILLDHERIGSIYIRSDLNDFYERILLHAMVTLLAFAAAMLLAYLLHSRLQRSITGPLHGLAELMGAVSRYKDYSVRSQIEQGDEIGTLAAGFNEMLEQLQRRDEELEMYRAHLEEKVSLRTTELARMNEKLQQELAERQRAEEQLRQSQKMEAVGRLSGGVAHDFNNILTAILGYATVVQRKMSADDPMRHNIDEVIAASRRAAALTQSLLAFSRKQVINLQPVDLPAVVERVSKLLQRLIGEDITLIRKYDESGITVVADAGQLEQVLMNLAANARDSMPHGGQLTIEIKRVEINAAYAFAREYMKHGSYALLTVSDTGTGMEQELATKIFEPFFTTKEVGKGTGLGLSIVLGIVKQHNGYIDVRSQPGQGTTFLIYLPIAGVDQRAADEAQIQLSPIRGGVETILMAEDDATLRGLAKLVLGEAGYTVIEAVDGLDAIEKIEQHRDVIDLLLLDVIMPKMNGRDVYRAAKQLQPGVKTLFISGYTADLMTDHGVAGEDADFIAKPVSPMQLLKKIREVLDR